MDFEPVYVESIGEPIYLELENPEQYTWSSSDPDVVGIVWDGIVVARSSGTAEITAQNLYERYTFTVKVDAVNWQTLGDVNGDGAVDTTDAIIVLNTYLDEMNGTSIFTPLTAEQIRLADVNRDGAADLMDAQLILQYYVNTALTGNLQRPAEAWAELL